MPKKVLGLVGEDQEWTGEHAGPSNQPAHGERGQDEVTLLCDPAEC